MLYDVIVTRPFDKVFTYASNEQLKIGLKQNEETLGDY